MEHQVNHPDREWMYENLEQPVLDAGCGNAVDAGGFTEYVGVDITPSLLRAGKLMFNVGNLVYADARHMPFRDNTFKTSFAKDLLLHLKPIDAMRALGELVRVGEKTFIAWGIMVYTGKKMLYTPLKDRRVICMLDGYWANRFSEEDLYSHGFVVGPVIEGTSITEVSRK